MALTDKKVWQQLRAHAVNTGNLHLSELLAIDDDRFEHFSLRHAHLLFDYSKQRLTQETTKLLCALARECDLSSWIERLFSGDPVNSSENRPALHTALRLPRDSRLALNGEDIVHGIHQTLDRMEQIVTRIHAGQWRGYSGMPVDTIVNIGVGGSDLGPFMAAKALADLRAPGARGLKMFFVSTMDGSQIAERLDTLNPATTLFIISSKSFTTIDTMSNANTALQWLRQASGAARTPRCSGCARPAAPKTKCCIAGISSAFQPRPKRWPTGAFRPTAGCNCGTGSAGATRCGPPSACRSRSKSACTTFTSCSPARMRWISIF
jgi:glucose-6-phosphate isomerase